MSAKPLFYKITQIRSVIGMPPNVRKNVTALGLKKRNQTIYQKISPSTAHRLAAVKELVKVELVDEWKTKEQVNKERKFKAGFEVLKGDMLNKRYGENL